MTRNLKLALACSGAGSTLALVCLFKTTSLTMSAFFFFGLPLSAAGIVLYGLFIAGVLRRYLAGQLP